MQMVNFIIVRTYLKDICANILGGPMVRVAMRFESRSVAEVPTYYYYVSIVKLSNTLGRLNELYNEET